MVDQNNLLGGLIGGTWANCYLFMIEIIMAIRFFTRFQDERLSLKCVVVLTLTVDLVSAINHFACAYMYMVLHWGNDAFLQNQYWPFPVYLITTGLSAFIVQQFLIHQYWSLTKSWIVTSCLSLISLTAFGGAVSAAVFVVRHSKFEDREEVKIPVMIWLVASSAANICTTSALLVAVHRLKAPFNKTQSLIRQLATLAMQTGVPGSILATIALIVYLIAPDGNIYIGIGFILGRVYAITMLYNLIFPKQTQERSAGFTHGLPDLHKRDITTIGKRRGPAPADSEIYISCTSIVQIDQEKSSDTAASTVKKSCTDSG